MPLPHVCVACGEIVVFFIANYLRLRLFDRPSCVRTIMPRVLRVCFSKESFTRVPRLRLSQLKIPLTGNVAIKNKKPLTNFLVVSIPKIGVTTETNESLGDELQQMLCSALRAVLRHSPYSCMSLRRFIRKCVSPGGND